MVTRLEHLAAGELFGLLLNTTYPHLYPNSINSCSSLPLFQLHGFQTLIFGTLLVGTSRKFLERKAVCYIEVKLWRYY
jgi:hypothetical protein